MPWLLDQVPCTESFEGGRLSSAPKTVLMGFRVRFCPAGLCATFVLMAGLLTGAAEAIEENKNPEKEAADGIPELDDTPYLAMPQADAASKFGLPTSRLSKLWKESANAGRGRIEQ